MTSSRSELFPCLYCFSTSRRRPRFSVVAAIALYKWGGHVATLSANENAPVVGNIKSIVMITT